MTTTTKRMGIGGLSINRPFECDPEALGYVDLTGHSNVPPIDNYGCWTLEEEAVAWFPALAGVILQALERCFEALIRVRSVDMLPTPLHSESLNMLAHVFQIETDFPHPHLDAIFSIVAICNLLPWQKPWGTHWPGTKSARGNWRCLIKLQHLQDGFRLGIDLTWKHVALHRNKLKVSLTVHEMSDPVSHSKMIVYDPKSVLEWNNFELYH